MAYRREPIPPSLSLSLSPSPSFSILTLFLPLPSFNLIFFLAPPLPRSFPTCQPSFSLSLSHSPFTHHHPFVPPSLSNLFFARSPSMAPPCFESPLYRAAPAITTHACHSASDVGHTLPALSLFRRPPLSSIPLPYFPSFALFLARPPFFSSSSATTRARATYLDAFHDTSTITNTTGNRIHSLSTSSEHY